jgi:AcrR family transcriptional regulator
MARKIVRDIRAVARVGRRPRGSPKLDRDTIVALGLALTKSTPLQDVSIVRIAREFGVTPASIHYHLDGREALTSGIVTLFVREMLDGWPHLTGQWRSDLEAVAATIYRHYVAYPGISAYFVAQNRFRVLVPAVEREGGDHLFRFLDHFFSAIGQANLDARRTAMYGLLLMRFIHTSAHATASHQWPGEQRLLKFHMSRLEQEKFPHIHRVREEYLHLAGDYAFTSGLGLMLDGLEVERRRQQKSGRD